MGRHPDRAAQKRRARGQDAGDLAAGKVLHLALQAVPAPSLHLAHLGWSGDGFAALVNYHKLDAKLLETLIYTYLGDWISRQKQDITSGIDGAQERLAAAEALKKKLELILEGEAPYDIFVRWKPLEQQPIGWNPDLNDGVRLNIRPFLSVPDVGKKGARARNICKYGDCIN